MTSPLSSIRMLNQALALSALATAPALAQIDVAICAAAQTSSTDCRFVDVQSKLLASGLFATVDILNASSSTPTLAQFQAYDAVIVWSNTSFQNSILLGDTLADYVDAGGGVVVAVFAVNWNTTTLSLQGRWQTGYEVILDQSGSTTGAATLGAVLLPQHPIMAGVVSFDGGTSSFRPTATVLAPGATAIADWSDGRVLVAEGVNPKRIDLGFYPPSSTCASGFWNVATDGDQLLANALLYAATANSCGTTSYCTGSTSVSGCTPTMSSSGTPSASASSGFNINCDDLPAQRNAVVFYGITGRQAQQWSAGSTSFLCVKPPTQRTLAQNSGGTPGLCDGTIGFDLLGFFAANPGALGQPIANGTTLDVQTWYRDPAAPKTTNLSDALEIALCP
ncbi:MAG: hypothetical protein IT454_15795 [Planctomycetes bacterium]|nr:hypothetical protein [Planctomycetota bacterium]